MDIEEYLHPSGRAAIDTIPVSVSFSNNELLLVAGLVVTGLLTDQPNSIPPIAENLFSQLSIIVELFASYASEPSDSKIRNLETGIAEKDVAPGLPWNSFHAYVWKSICDFYQQLQGTSHAGADIEPLIQSIPPFFYRPLNTAFPLPRLFWPSQVFSEYPFDTLPSDNRNIISQYSADFWMKVMYWMAKGVMDLAICHITAGFPNRDMLCALIEAIALTSYLQVALAKTIANAWEIDPAYYSSCDIFSDIDWWMLMLSADVSNCYEIAGRCRETFYLCPINRLHVSGFDQWILGGPDLGSRQLKYVNPASVNVNYR